MRMQMEQEVLPDPSRFSLCGVSANAYSSPCGPLHNGVGDTQNSIVQVFTTKDVINYVRLFPSVDCCNSEEHSALVAVPGSGKGTTEFDSPTLVAECRFTYPLKFDPKFSTIKCAPPIVSPKSFL